jgi:uncharacterized protein (TIGR02271 family)
MAMNDDMTNRPGSTGSSSSSNQDINTTASTDDNSTGRAVGMGVGGVSGVATGALIGTAIGGPVGTAIGAIAGALVGAGSGAAIAEANRDDDDYYRENFNTRPYVSSDDKYEDYADAYRFGRSAADKHENVSTFADVEHDLRRDYETSYANRSTGDSGTTTGAGGTTAMGDTDTATTGGASGMASGIGAAAMAGAAGASASSGMTDAGGTVPPPIPYERARPAIEDAFNRRLKLREEQLRVGKERVQTGEAQISKEVITEHRQVDVPVTREELVIERRPVNETLSGQEIGDDLRDETIRIPLTEEQVRVSKDTVVKEEVELGKRQVQETRHVEADVRREELRTDQHANTTRPGQSAGDLDDEVLDADIDVNQNQRNRTAGNS